MHQKRKLFLFCCVSSILFGTVILSIWPTILKTIYRTLFIIKPDSKVFNLWKESQFPIQIDFYFFNWTNPEDFYNLSVKPKFKEVGPYRFREERKKVKITFHSENNTVTYKQVRIWHFDESFADKEILLDPITTINPVSLSAAYTARDWSQVMKRALSMTISSITPSVHITKSVSEFLFDGYEDPLLSMAQRMQVDGVPQEEKFAWFFERNNSDRFEGLYNVGVGANNDFGVLYKWNNANRTSFYGSSCGELKGSAGELFTGKMDQDSLLVFTADACKTIKLDYLETMRVENIMGYKYVIGDSFLDNGTLIPENSCQCMGDCLPSGAVNISACKYGSPGFVSLPHFYKADPYYVNIIEGMQPNKSKHEFSITLEPETGIPLDATGRFQINLFVQPIDGIRMFEKVPRVLFPMLWFEEKFRIPSYLGFQIKLLLNFSIISIITGLFFILAGLITFFCVYYQVCICKLCSKSPSKSSKETVPLTENKNKAIISEYNYRGK